MRISVNGQRSLATSPGLAKSRHSGAELPQARLIRIGGLCHAAEFAKRHRATDIRKKARTQWLTTGSLPAQSCKKREGINRETGGLYPRAPCLARQPDRLTPFQDNLPLDGAGAYWTLVQPGLRSSAGVFLRDFPEAASPRG